MKGRIQSLLILLACLAGVCQVAAQNTVFTYQGLVTDNGTNFTGTGQFEFALVTGTNISSQATATAMMSGSPPHETVQSFHIVSAGMGYVNPPTVVVAGGGGAGATGTANVSGGGVASITVVSGGSGYITAPSVSIAAPPPDIAYVTYWSNDGTSSAGSEPATAVSVVVSNGLFTVVLGDTTLANMTAISASLFSQPGLQLRIWFNDGVAGFAALSPVQNVTPAPYAAYAAAAGSAVTAVTAAVATTAGSVAATNISGSILVAQLSAAVVTNGATNVTFSGTFSGNGAGLTGISSTSLATPPGMTLIPAGAFTMGDNLDGESDALPTLSVTVSAFYMDVNLVTFSQWQSVYFWATSQGYSFDNAGMGVAANHPVQVVRWYDAVKWCNARSQQSGRAPIYYTDAAFTHVYTNGDVDLVYANWTNGGYRLPTEAEWEKAARGGLAGQRFPWGKVITEFLANYYGSTDSFAYDLGPTGYNGFFATGETPYTSPVGNFAPNGYGLCDMAGNVLEWCWDWYGKPYAGGADPRGPASGSARVFRGGAWDDLASSLRCAARASGAPSGNFFDLGFRCVKGP